MPEQPEADPIISESITIVTPSDDELAEGRVLYRKHCMACHGENGIGTLGFPQIKSLVRPGISMDKSETLRPLMFGRAAMPAYSDALSIQEIVSVSNYVRHGWGNRATSVVHRNDVFSLIKSR
jgi:mono/diheme cytochrome c family protein